MRSPAAFLMVMLACLPAAVAAEEAPAGRKPSLIFTDSEMSAVEKALAAYDKISGVSGANESETSGAPDEIPATNQPNVTVSAVMDLGDGNWTVWANGYRIRPGHQAPGFTVVGVKNDMVDIVVPGEQEARLRLKPNQTWRARHHDVVEGLAP